MSHRRYQAGSVAWIYIGGNGPAILCVPHPASLSWRTPVCRIGAGNDVVNESGQSVVNEKGVGVSPPFQAMPVEFFGDTDGSKYRAALL